MPSGMSMAIDLLLRLHDASGEPRHLTAAVNAARRLSGKFRDHPESWTSAITALNDHPLPSTLTKETSANAAANTRAPAGSVKIVAKFPKDGLKGFGSVQGTVTMQDSSNQICLPPSELPISVSGR